MKPVLPLLVLLLVAVFLRSWLLPELPNGLHWDEMDTGYQAYSLFKTGRDYFANPLPLFLHSFADFRTPVFIYSAIPWVAGFGLTPQAVRLPAVMWGLVAVASLYLLTYFLFRSRAGAVFSSFALSVSLWHLIYSRKSVETGSLMALVLISTTLFIRGLRRPGYLVLSGLFFALSTLAYSPGKLFIPLLVSSLVLLFRSQLHALPKKYLVTAGLTLAVVALPGYSDAVFGSSGLRLSHLAVWTDPTTADEVDRLRLQFALSTGRPREVGLTTQTLEKILYNKPALWLARILENYYSTFSTQFLFTRGDPEPRHSPGKNAIGMLHLAEVVPLGLGLIYLATRFRHPAAKLLLVWLALSPLPSALTRDGGTHAARLLLLLPALLMVISLGLRLLLHKSKILFAFLCALYFVSIFSDLAYFFSLYRHESAAPYQWGFPQMISRAVVESPRYDRVFVDFKDDSPLMAYLFTTRLDPAQFQALHPLTDVQVNPQFTAKVFGNIYLLNIGTRHWTDISLPANTLVISHASQPLMDQIQPTIDTLDYPDNQPAFSIFVK